MDERLSPEERALDDLTYSEVAPDLYLQETIPLFHVLKTIYSAGSDGAYIPDVEIDWSEDAIVVSCSINQHILLQLIRLKVEELTFVPHGWTVFFSTEDDRYHLDSLSLINARRRT